MTESECWSGRHVTEGVEVLRWHISLPRAEGAERMSGLYHRMGESLAAFCEGELRERAESDYVRCDDPRKRFRFPAFFYRLESETLEEGDLVTVRLRLRFGRRGGREAPYLWESTQRWSLSEDCLIPPRPTKKKAGGDGATEKQ